MGSANVSLFIEWGSEFDPQCDEHVRHACTQQPLARSWAHWYAIKQCDCRYSVYRPYGKVEGERDKEPIRCDNGSLSVWVQLRAICA